MRRSYQSADISLGFALIGGADHISEAGARNPYDPSARLVPATYTRLPRTGRRGDLTIPVGASGTGVYLANDASRAGGEGR